VSETKDARPFAFVLLCRVEAIGLAFIDELETPKKEEENPSGIHFRVKLHQRNSFKSFCCCRFLRHISHALIVLFSFFCFVSICVFSPLERTRMKQAEDALAEEGPNRIAGAHRQPPPLCTTLYTTSKYAL
jgi:hypothetical protein